MQNTYASTSASARLRAAASLGPEDRALVLGRLLYEGAWPFGMPTCVNPARGRARRFSRRSPAKTLGERPGIDPSRIGRGARSTTRRWWSKWWSNRRARTLGRDARAEFSRETLSRRADSNCRPAVYECAEWRLTIAQDVSFFEIRSPEVSRDRLSCPETVVKTVVSRTGDSARVLRVLQLPTFDASEYQMARRPCAPACDCAHVPGDGRRERGPAA